MLQCLAITLPQPIRSTCLTGRQHLMMETVNMERHLRQPMMSHCQQGTCRLPQLTARHTTVGCHQPPATANQSPSLTLRRLHQTPQLHHLQRQQNRAMHLLRLLILTHCWRDPAEGLHHRSRLLHRIKQITRPHSHCLQNTHCISQLLPLVMDTVRETAAAMMQATLKLLLQVVTGN